MKETVQTRKTSKNRKPAERRRANPRNRQTALWLWCPPVGLPMMWRRSCTWPFAVKVSVTALVLAVIVAVFALPTAVPGVSRTEGGIHLVGNRPEVEVYGPELPVYIVPGYVNDQVDSIIVPAETTEVHYVYAAKGAECYHEYDCKFAFASSQRLTVYEAYYMGYKPCGRCNPPIYEGP